MNDDDLTALRWRRVCPRRFRDFRLATSPQQSAAEKAATWLNSNEPDEGGTLLIYGPTGTGKTGLAVGILRARFTASPDDPPVFINAPEWLEAQRPGRFADRDAMRDAQLAPLLVVDDLGAELQTDWALERYYLLFNERYMNELPTVVTTNIDTPLKIAEAVGERLMSRLGERATLIRLGGDDLRFRGMG